MTRFIAATTGGYDCLPQEFFNPGCRTVPPVKSPAGVREVWKPNPKPSVCNALLSHCPEIQSAQNLAQEFLRIIRQRQRGALDSWVAKACDARSPREFAVFAHVLKRDYSAVQASLTLPWSNGQVEGNINRLKLIKREMYGRAKFDLLRQRVLHVA